MKLLVIFVLMSYVMQGLVHAQSSTNRPYSTGSGSTFRPQSTILSTPSTPRATPVTTKLPTLTTRKTSTAYYQLSCYSCANCNINKIDALGCTRSQSFCIKQVKNNVLSRGCAETCKEGSGTYCCKKPFCNDSIQRLSMNNLTAFFILFTISCFRFLF